MLRAVAFATAKLAMPGVPRGLEFTIGRVGLVFGRTGGGVALSQNKVSVGMGGGFDVSSSGGGGFSGGISGSNVASVNVSPPDGTSLI